MTIDNLLIGPASLDRYFERPGVSPDVVLPGGGALNMAYHWSKLGLPFCFLSRIGDDHAQLFIDFLKRHRIAYSSHLVVHGASASIDIAFGVDRQPTMNNFIEGVWATFRVVAAEEALLAEAKRVHVVLVDAVVAEVERLGAAGALGQLDISGDFLDFRHFSVRRFEETMRWLRTAFIGWPGDVDDPTIVGLLNVVRRAGKLAVITLGARGVLVLDARGSSFVERLVPVDAVAVVGATVGCGDSFIAAFLAHWWRSKQSAADVFRAVAAGAALGAAATGWLRPLPDDAYG